MGGVRKQEVKERKTIEKEKRKEETRLTCMLLDQKN